MHTLLAAASDSPFGASLWVSIASACIAAAALAVALTNELRDRPRVTVEARSAVRGGEPQISAWVANLGRQPITVGPLGLTWDLDPPIDGLPACGEIALENPFERHSLAPGTSLARDWPIPAGLPVHQRTPMRVVVYVGNERAYSEPKAYLASIARALPELQTSLGVSDTPLETPRGRRLVASWKLWRPRHLRTRPVDGDEDPTAVRQQRSEWLAQLPAMPIWTRPQPGTGAWMQPRGEREADQS